MPVVISGTDGVDQSGVTGAAEMPVGTTLQRPATPTAGMYRMNTTTNEPEWYNTSTSSWQPLSGKRTAIAMAIIFGG
jgi:hypothetical protein